MNESTARAERYDLQTSTSSFFLWEVPQKPVAVRIPYELIDRLEREAVESFRSVTSRGSEIGGLLIGDPTGASPTVVSVAEYQLIECEYSRGPLFRLSDADVLRFRRAIEQSQSNGYGIAGFFRTHTRKGMGLDADDLALMDAHLRDPHQFALLVRPFATKASAAGIFIRENGKIQGDASYLEFAFRSPAPEGKPSLEGPEAKAAPAPSPAPQAAKPAARAQIVPIASRREISLPSTLGEDKPAMIPEAATPVSAPVASAPAVSPPPASPAPEDKTARPEKPAVESPTAKAEPKSASKVEMKPIAKVEAKAEPKPEAKPAPKVETKPVTKVEAKAEPKPEIKPEAKAQPRPEAKTESKAEPKPESKLEPKLKSEPKTETKPEPKAALKEQEKPVVTAPAVAAAAPAVTVDPAETAPSSGKGLKLVLAALATTALFVILFVYPGVLRNSNKPAAPTAGDASPLQLRVERTNGELLLTWNRDSDAVRNATKAVLQINDGEQHENVEMDLAQLRNGSIVYSPQTADISFKMEVTGKDASKTASESVRVLRTRPSPLQDQTAAQANTTQKPAQPSTTPAPNTAQPTPSNQAAATTAPAPETPAQPETKPVTPTRQFRTETLGQRLRPTQSTDLPDAPTVSGGSVASAIPGMNLNVGATPSAPVPVPPVPSASAEKVLPKAGGQIQQAVLVSKKDPEYPKLARQTGARGAVRLTATVGKDGHVKTVKVISGHPMLQAAAVEAVKQWVYKPTLLNGQPVETDTEIVLNFLGDK